VAELNRNLILLYYVCILAGLERHQIKTAEAVNKRCHDIGLRKQHLGYHKSWDCWYCILLVWFCVLHCVDVGSAYWR